MDLIRILLSRCTAPFQRRKLDTDLDEELRSHIDLAVEENLENGMSEQEARTASLRDFGGVTQAAERYRVQRGLPLVDVLIQDLRFALRQLRNSPGFTLTVLITLALGIGANIAIFSVVNAVILKPLPYPNSDRVVMIFLQNSSLGVEDGDYGVADFLALRQQQRSFEDVAAITSPDDFALTGEQAPEEIRGSSVTAAFFEVLGVKPQIGRTFLPGEDQPGKSPSVVVSDRFWRKHLHADRTAPGRSITLAGTSYTVVGVMPANFHFGREDTDQVWPIFLLQTPAQRPPFFLEAIGRLKLGVSAAGASADASRIVAGVTLQYPESGNINSSVKPLKEVLVGSSRSTLLLMLGAVALVLLIAVVNVANLQLARSAVRQREMAIRTALGAGRRRLMQQLLTESALLSTFGCAIGLSIAYWGLRAIVTINPGVVPRMSEIAMDRTVFLFALGIAVLAAVLFGLAPAFRIHSPHIGDCLKQSGRGTFGDPNSGLSRDLLVISEFSLALVLLIGAGLLIRSLSRLESVSPGFDSSQLMTMELALPPQQYAKASQVTAFYQQLLDNIENAPGVEAAGITMSLPPNQLEVMNPFHLEGQSYESSRAASLAEEIPISRDYFRALGIPLLAGRLFDDGDRVPSHHVLLINQTMARRYFAGKDAVGQRVQTGNASPKSDWYSIVGVVGDVKYEGLDAKEQPTMYVPYTDDGWSPWFVKSMSLVVRTRAGSSRIESSVRAAVDRLDRTVPIVNVLTMRQLLSESVSSPRFNTILLGTFAALALVLAAVGIYGVMAYSVARRSREIGVRIALGAQRGQVLRLIIRHGAKLALIGVGIGIIASLVLTRLMSSLLFDISATDPSTIIAVAALLFFVAVAACYIPARRAMMVDPMVALRDE